MRRAALRSPGNHTGSTSTSTSDHASSVPARPAPRCRWPTTAAIAAGPYTSATAEALTTHGTACRWAPRPTSTANGASETSPASAVATSTTTPLTPALRTAG